MAEIKFSREYSRFERITGNRMIDEKRVDKLVKTVQQGVDLMDSSPIKVYEDGDKFKIIDGQHRYLACVKLGRLIPYIVVPKMDIHEIAILNKNQKAWSMAEYIEAYCEQGVESYLVLKRFANANNMDYATAIDFIGPRSGSGRGSATSDAIRSGAWKATRYEFGIGRAKMWREYSSWFGSKTQDFRRAFFGATATEEYDHNHMRSRVQLWKKEIVKKYNREDWLRYFEEIYNHQTREEKRIRFF